MSVLWAAYVSLRVAEGWAGGLGAWAEQQRPAPSKSGAQQLSSRKTSMGARNGSIDWSGVDAAIIEAARHVACITALVRTACRAGLVDFAKNCAHAIPTFDATVGGYCPHRYVGFR